METPMSRIFGSLPDIDDPREQHNYKPVPVADELMDLRNETIKLRTENARLREALERSGYDVCSCIGCGEMTVGVPDGLTMCAKCAEKEECGE